MSDKIKHGNCEPGCKGRILNARRGVYCDCLSRQLPRGSGQSIDAECWDDIDDASGFVLKESRMPRIEEEVIEAKMRMCGCTDQEIGMIFDRVFAEATLDEIAKKYSLGRRQNADRALQKIFKKLREAGFDLFGEEKRNA